MTAPVQEPNLYRHTSGLQWGQNQLFRRPAPVGSTNACLYAMTVWNGLQAIPDDTAFNLTDMDNTGADGEWTDGYVSDVDQIEVDLTTGEISVLGTEAQGGIYLATLKVLYDNQFAGDLWTAVNWTSWTLFNQMDSELQYQKAQNGTSHVFGETGVCTSMQLVLDATPVANPSLKGSFWQVSGSPQNIFQVSFSVCRVCLYPGDNGGFVT